MKSEYELLFCDEIYFITLVPEECRKKPERKKIQNLPFISSISQSTEPTLERKIEQEKERKKERKVIFII